MAADRLSVEEVLTRIRTLTGDLKVIREEISKEVFRPDPGLGRNIFLEAADSGQTIQEFRAAIDDLRHIVWLYIESAPNRTTHDPDVQRKLVARATEILCALSLNPPLPQPDIDPMERSFVERLMRFMESWIDPKIRDKMEPQVSRQHASNACH
jgi:hypothetical protein